MQLQKRVRLSIHLIRPAAEEHKTMRLPNWGQSLAGWQLEMDAADISVAVSGQV
ncbi:hypothetical protein TGAM01_v210482 [Trichoderma gamsii]|uniref:Uncharacterized protein n=1 Tax=Trichoderma gamsii TaxID=398673 RepID=A0A2P4Z8S4_9HYPO|nr:hypothetical protein TGAM01_v210482 [Trichoderma gamsii]PON20697.1 hypothetical protein TGAM01_v210482 [Trichoderma gamsii]